MTSWTAMATWVLSSLWPRLAWLVRALQRPKPLEFDWLLLGGLRQQTKVLYAKSLKEFAAWVAQHQLDIDFEVDLDAALARYYRLGAVRRAGFERRMIAMLRVRPHLRGQHPMDTRGAEAPAYSGAAQTLLADGEGRGTRSRLVAGRSWLRALLEFW